MADTEKSNYNAGLALIVVINKYSENILLKISLMTVINWKSLTVLANIDLSRGSCAGRSIITPEASFLQRQKDFCVDEKFIEVLHKEKYLKIHNWKT